MSSHIRRGFIYLFSQNSSSLCKPPRVCGSLSSTISESLVQKYHSHPQPPSQLPTVSTALNNPPKSDTPLSFLMEIGFSATQLEKMLKSWPKLLAMNLDKTMKPKIKILQDFGFSSDEIVGIISKDPTVLHSSVDKRFIPTLSVLKGLLGSTEKVAKFLKASSWYLRINLDKNLVPNIDFLTSCGVAMDRIFWLMYYFPRIMLQKPENMKKFVEKAHQMGADSRSNMFIHCVRVICSMTNENWELKMKVFRDVGFSEHDIMRVFRVAPMVFGASEEKIRKVKEVILATGKYDTSCIINDPTSLCRSIEKRYKPRIEVLKILEGKNLITKWPGFTAMYKLTDKEFVEKFVSPYYDEVGKVYMSMISPRGKREVNSVPSP